MNMKTTAYKKQTIFLHEFALFEPSHHIPRRARRQFSQLVRLAQALPEKSRRTAWRLRPFCWEESYKSDKGRRRGYYCDNLNKLEVIFCNLVSRISFFQLPWTVSVSLDSIDRARQLSNGEDVDLGLMAEICRLFRIPFKIVP